MTDKENLLNAMLNEHGNILNDLARNFDDKFKQACMDFAERCHEAGIPDQLSASTLFAVVTTKTCEFLARGSTLEPAEAGEMIKQGVETTRKAWEKLQESKKQDSPKHKQYMPAMQCGTA